MVYCCDCTTAVASLLRARFTKDEVEEEDEKRAVLVFHESKVVMRAPGGGFCLCSLP